MMLKKDVLMKNRDRGNIMILNKELFDKFIEESEDSKKLDIWCNRFENGELEFDNIGYKISFLNSLGKNYSDRLSETGKIEIIFKQNYIHYRATYYYEYALYVYENECDKNYYFEDRLIKRIYVNLGVEYSKQYRILEALSCYKKSLDIDPNFSMALFNRAIVLNKIHHIKYYCDINKYYLCVMRDMFLVDNNKLECPIEAYEFVLNKYLNFGSELILREQDITKAFKICRGKVDNYENFCLHNDLFLNPLNSIDIFVEAKRDVTILENLPKEIIPLYEEVVDYYKYLRKKIYKFRRNKKNNDILRDCIEVFKGVYSIFDKIAYIISKVCKLDLKEKEINFHRIWNAKICGSVDKKLSDIKNVYLYSLYWIKSDFMPDRDKLNDSINRFMSPEYQDFANLRNRLEHRVERISQFDFQEIYKKTLGILKVMRNAIVNLNWFLYDESYSALYDDSGKRNFDLCFLPEVFMLK